MSYVFDIYRGKREPVSSFIEYAVFVCFFPLLVAGPIERANHLLPQVQQKRFFSYEQAIGGCRLMLWGTFKKVVVADSLAPLVATCFNQYQHHNAVTLIVGAVAFSFQIYGDFSGYSDIAIGCAKLFGFELLSNFRFPYFSRDIAEFWRRWHISLTSWFRDYLYIPIGGSKNGRWKTIRNVFIVFLVSGFWHGASWNFITWGAIHACAFLPVLLSNKNRVHVGEIVASNSKLPTIKELMSMLLTFAWVTIAWIFFRQQHIHDAFGVLIQIASSSIHQPAQFFHPWSALPAGIMAFPLLLIFPMIMLDWKFRRNERDVLSFHDPRWSRLVYYAMFFAICYAAVNGQAEQFIYFKF